MKSIYKKTEIKLKKMYKTLENHRKLEKTKDPIHNYRKL